jgi:hypothetical protein
VCDVRSGIGRAKKGRRLPSHALPSQVARTPPFLVQERPRFGPSFPVGGWSRPWGVTRCLTAWRLDCLAQHQRECDEKLPHDAS